MSLTQPILTLYNAQIWKKGEKRATGPSDVCDGAQWWAVPSLYQPGIMVIPMPHIVSLGTYPVGMWWLDEYIIT